MRKNILPTILAGIVCLGTYAQAGSLEDSLKGSLVQLKDKEVVKADDSALSGKKIVAIYYSAHWCPPCRKFTPDLVKFYNEASKKYPNFEMVFVSSDKNADAMKEYMEWGKMNWPAVEFSKKEASGLTKHGARGIPYLVVLDENGKELIGKAAGQDWRPPTEVLGELKKLLEKEGAAS